MGSYFISIAALVAVSATFSGTEAAFLSVSGIRLRTLADKGNRRAKTALGLKNDLRSLLGVVLGVQNVCDALATALATVAATQLTGSIGVGLATGVMSLIGFVLVNLIPKSLAADSPMSWVLFMAYPARWAIRLLSPLTSLIDRSVSRFLPGGGALTSRVRVSEDDIRTMARIGVQEGSVASGERDMIERVFLMNDITAFDIMTPTEEMVMLEADSTIAEAVVLVNSSGFSRYPVFRQDKTKIVGIAHMKEMFQRLSDNLEDGLKVTVGQLMDPPVFVPKTKPIDHLLRDFQELRTHLALVVNERGSVVGLVTLEDLLEELVGEIVDETDIDSHVIKRIDKDTIVVHGEVRVADVNRFFNTKIEASPHRTLAWVVMKELGSIPQVGQKVPVADRLTATVEEMVDLRVSHIRLDKKITKEENKP